MVIAASFIKLLDGQVYLEQNGATMALELSQFTETDQQLIATISDELIIGSRTNALYSSIRISAETIFAVCYLFATGFILLLARKRWYFRLYNMQLMAGLFFVGILVFVYFS